MYIYALHLKNLFLDEEFEQDIKKTECEAWMEKYYQEFSNKKEEIWTHKRYAGKVYKLTKQCEY